MSAKSAMETRFKNRECVRIITVPKSMRPTAESMKKMGRRISSHIRRNNTMRNNSIINASERFVN